MADKRPPAPPGYHYQDGLFGSWGPLVKDGAGDTAARPQQQFDGMPDYANADDERGRLGGLLAQLQQQAASGGGSWEQTLAQGTQSAQNAAQAIGQSQAGVGYGSALRNVANAQGAASQQGAGQANILRNQSQLDAQQQIAKLTGQMTGQDLNQAVAASGASQANEDLKQQILGANTEAGKSGASGSGQAAAGSTSMSDGGAVPGRPEVFGDDEKNDTVPAWLSPGEIVIPRSHTGSPEAAADFVRALQASKSHARGNHFDDGGQIPGAPAPIIIPSVGPNGVASLGTSESSPTVQNGGLLNTLPYEQSRNANVANNVLLRQQSMGAGPSVVPQRMQNATDSNIAAAMQARMPGRNGAGAGDIVSAATGSEQGAAWDAATARAKEQESGQNAFATSLLGLRSQDAALAQAKHDAALANAARVAGLSLQQRAAMRQLASGASQAVGPSIDLLKSAFTSGSGADTKSNDDYAKGTAADLHGYGDEKHDGGFIEAYASGGTIPRDSRSARLASAFDSAPRFFNGGGPDAWMTALPARMDSGPAAYGIDPAQAVPNAGLPVPPEPMGFRRTGTTIGPTPPEDTGWHPLDNMARAAEQDPIYKTLDAATDKAIATKAALPASLIPKADYDKKMADQASQPAVAPIVPAVAPKPGVGFGSGRLSSKEGDAATAAEEAATREKAGIAADLSTKLALQAAEEQKRLQAHALDEADRTRKATADSEAMMADIQKRSDEMRNIDTTVDPGRFWATRSTGQKISGIIGMALGALGTGPDGVNRAAMMLNQAIDRDIDAQKSEHDLRLRKGQASVNAATSAYGLHRQAIQDDVAARAAAKATLDDLSIAKVKQITAAAGGPMAQANGNELIARLEADKATNHQKIAQQTFDNSVKGSLAAAEIEKDRVVAGAKGNGINPAEAKELHAAEASTQNSLDLINKIRGTLKDTNSPIPGKTALNQNVGAQAADLDTTTTSLVLELKNAAKLGAISGTDADLLKSLIGDPKAIFTNESTKRAKLDALEGILKRGIQNQRASAMGAQAR